MTRPRTVTALLLGALVLLQLQSRFVAAPGPAFTSDDWAHYQRSIAPPSYLAICGMALHEPDRPVQAILLHATYRALGMDPVAHCAFSMAMYSVFLGVGLLLVWLLTESRLAVAVFGITLCALPNLTESFHWGAMTTVAYMQISYLLSAVGWVLFVRGARAWTLLLSVVFYLLALASYEFGFALPAVLFALSSRKTWRRNLLLMAPYATVFCFYMVWRLTHAFGMGRGVLFETRQIEISLYVIAHNGLDVVSWWIGPRMARCIAQGWAGFTTLAAQTQILLIAANLGAACLAAKWVCQAAQNEVVRPPTRPFSIPQVMAFGMAWAILGTVTSLFSWTAGRLNLYPAVGVAIFLAGLALLRASPARIAAFCAILFACLFVNQGTAKQWKDSGVFHQRLFEHLQETELLWADRKIIVFDTRALRQRLTAGLVSPIGLDPNGWAYYGNANLIRGFVPGAMLELARPGAQLPRVVLDTECGVRINSEEVLWHDRYDPSKPNRTTLDQAYIVDCFKVGTEGR